LSTNGLEWSGISTLNLALFAPHLASMSEVVVHQLHEHPGALHKTMGSTVYL